MVDFLGLGQSEEYLSNGLELQIKMAQGAKPGGEARKKTTQLLILLFGAISWSFSALLLAFWESIFHFLGLLFGKSKTASTTQLGCCLEGFNYGF